MSEEVKAETPPVAPAAPVSPPEEEAVVNAAAPVTVAPAVTPVAKPVVVQPWVSKRKKPSSIDEKQAALKGK